jgi:uroporphyrinogen decarboxylase
MTARMTKRERVEAAMNLQETDRVPIYDMLLNDAAIEHFSGKYPPLGEEGIRALCEAVGRMLDMTRAVYYGPKEQGEWIDAEGFVRYRFDRYRGGGIRKRPFADEDGARAWLTEAIRRLKRETESLDLGEYAEVHKSRFRQLQGYIGDDTVVLEEVETGLDELRAALGWEQFAYIVADDPGLISEYIEVYTGHTVKIIHAIADRRMTPCALVAGDIAMKGALLHSPAWLRREFLPSLRRLITAWHEHDVKCLFHSDGYLMEILPDLVEAGIDGLNPVETVAGMDLKEVKELFGNRIFITGGIDMSQLLSRGTPDEVRRASREAIAMASPGYFLGSTSELDNSAKLENILAMLDVAWGTHQER